MVLRWTLIVQAYKKIRDLVIFNHLAMEKTDIQLVEVNQNTLTRWYALERGTVEPNTVFS